MLAQVYDERFSFEFDFGYGYFGIIFRYSFADG